MHEVSFDGREYSILSLQLQDDRIFLVFRGKYASQTMKNVHFPYEKRSFSSSIRFATRE